jgi:methylation protein EvaC
MSVCHLCQQPRPTEFLDLGQQPLANKYPTQDQFSAEKFFPLKVYFCERCSNVQLGTVVSRELMFQDYYYLSSVNGALVRHFESFAETLKNARFVVDVGSNDGILLRPLKERGVRAIGVEPSVNVSKIANDEGLETVCAFFDAESAARVRDDYGAADVIVASSVFTHLENPHEFIEAVKILLADGGEFVIEVEYIGNIVTTIQFERFYLDRIFYYSLASLNRLFNSHDMHITDVEHIDMHGGSLRVTVRRDGDKSALAELESMLAAEAKILNPRALKEFSDNAGEQVVALRTLLEKHKRSKVKVAGYGAPARLSTISNFGQIGPELVAFSVDDSPLKQNKYSPGVHIPIVPKAYLDRERPDVVVVFAYEYFEDIRAKAGDAYRYMLPIPPREID